MSATALKFRPDPRMADHSSSRAAKPTAAAPAALTSVELLARARGGDDLALNDLCARYLPRLQKWAHGRLPAWARGALDTHDLVQETLAQAIQRIGTFEPRHDGAFPAFLRTVLINRLRDHLRYAQRRPTGTLKSDWAADAPSPFEEAVGREAVERYEAALDRLKEPDREAIIARIELQQSYEEVAIALGKPNANAARMAVTRALARLIEAMQHER